MNSLQEKLLQLLSFFHNFCVDNELRYYVLGGTMLGAARHKGFIPWDDDVDVGMPRSDYEKLATFNEFKRHGYFLEMQNSNNEGYTFCHAKLFDTNTTLIENKRKKLIRGIYIDIFPLDGIADSEEECKKNYRAISIEKKILDLRNMNVSQSRHMLKNMIIRGTNALPEMFFSEKRIINRITKRCKSKDFDACKYGGNLVGAWGYKEIMERSFFGEQTLYQFENIEVYGVEKYDEYLSKQYGDWRSIPPKEQQKSHHDYYLDLNTPYEEWDTHQ